jgi:hypothetical protein
MGLLIGSSFFLLAADYSIRFLGHWKLKPEQSEIHPGSQWVTDELDIQLVGRLLELTEKQSFGEGEDLIRQEDKSLILPNSRLSKGQTETVTRWSHNMLVERSSFVVRGLSEVHTENAVTQLALTDPNTLVRTTTVTRIEKGRKVVLLYQREVFGRS